MIFLQQKVSSMFKSLIIFQKKFSSLFQEKQQVGSGGGGAVRSKKILIRTLLSDS